MKLGRLCRLFLGKSHRAQIVEQARAEQDYYAKRQQAQIQRKVNYLDLLVKQFQEDTRR